MRQFVREQQRLVSPAAFWDQSADPMTGTVPDISTLHQPPVGIPPLGPRVTDAATM